MDITKSNYDYCEVSKDQGKYLVQYGYQFYGGRIISPPIKIGERSFSTEKKALRYAKKISDRECIRLNK
ncbi:MAG: hypothetical protein WCV43_04715 [Candidatus Caldatribacteriota bacterium]|jgi:hypothetical protein|nr:hypothetical protein [Atribacterota bacterium]MDD3641001.1 hypothetical protein [Atribacterota bacterium]MDD4289083.1 hypothetical protein [Atribacterota bacterium]MDD4764469.1 hypothetical protein [Atribacterota bacterium]MDD5636034.1 hypothetical protein [Atribacterota bacterium]